MTEPVRFDATLDPRYRGRGLKVARHRRVSVLDLPTRNMLWDPDVPERLQMVLNRLGFRHHARTYIISEALYNAIASYWPPLSAQGGRGAPLLQEWTRLPTKAAFGSWRQREFDGPMPREALEEYDYADGYFHGMLLCWNEQLRRYAIWGLLYNSVEGGRYGQPEYFPIATWSYEQDPEADFAAPEHALTMASSSIHEQYEGRSSFLDDVGPDRSESDERSAPSERPRDWAEQRKAIGRDQIRRATEMTRPVRPPDRARPPSPKHTSQEHRLPTDEIDRDDEPRRSWIFPVIIAVSVIAIIAVIVVLFMR